MLEKLASKTMINRCPSNINRFFENKRMTEQILFDSSIKERNLLKETRIDIKLW